MPKCSKSGAVLKMNLVITYIVVLTVQYHTLTLQQHRLTLKVLHFEISQTYFEMSKGYTYLTSARLPQKQLIGK